MCVYQDQDLAMLNRDSIFSVFVLVGAVMSLKTFLLDFFAKIDFLVSFCSSWPVDYENFGCHFSKVSKGVKGIIFQLQKMAAKCNAYHSAF